MSQTITIPLANLKLQHSDSIDLGDSIIKPIDDVSEAVRSVARLSIDTDTNPPFMPLDFALQTHSEKEVDDALAEDMLNRSLTIFKLFKDSAVYSNVVVIGEPPRGAYRLRHYKPWSRVPIDPYYLADNERDAFVRFWKQFTGLNPRSFPVYRFHLADFRPYLADRVVDYVESLEDLLVPDSSGGEIGYKFRSRGTLVIGRDEVPKDREVLYKALKDAYDFRSAIVHGEDFSKFLANSTFENKVAQIRRYDRFVIRFFFKSGCLDDVDKRKELLNQRLIYDAQMSWKSAEEFGGRS